MKKLGNNKKQDEEIHRFKIYEESDFKGEEHIFAESQV